MVSIVIPSITVSLIFMFALWTIQLKTRNAGIVDIGWTVCVFFFGCMYFLKGPGFFQRKILFFIMIGLWAGRLVYHLVSRGVFEQEDARYQRLRREWGQHIQIKFLFLFLFEALLAFVIAVPFLIASRNLEANIGLWEYAACILWICGFLGEFIADQQLKDFKQDPSNKGKTCQCGLWYYSRHPNYFFEWVMWVAYFTFALNSEWGIVAVIAPAVMWFFLVYVTGIPFAEEQALKNRGDDYRSYQQTTSFFVPWPKKMKVNDL